MSNLTPRRRLAAIAGGLTAAFAGMMPLLTSHAHTATAQNRAGFAAGFAIGLPFVLVVFLLLRRRRACDQPVPTKGV